MKNYKTNPQVRAVATPPIAEVHAWIEGRVFPDHKPLLDIAQAVPSYGPAASLLTHLAERMHDPSTALYTEILGLPELRAALAGHLSQDYAGAVSPEQVAITAGCNQAFCVAMDALTEPGDEVVLALPYYFNHHMWLQMRGIKTRYIPFGEGEMPHLDTVESCISGSTRAIVLVTPNNPTGTEYPADFIETLFDVSRTHGLALVLDETYKDFRTCSTPPHNLLQRTDRDENLIQLFSFSKSYALTGYRAGALVAGTGFINQIAKILDCVAICPPHAGQLAALYGLNHLGDWRRKKAKILSGRVARLRQCFDNDALRYRLVSSGAYFAFVNHPFGEESAHAVARRLADEFNILCLPGSMFGPGQEAYLRFAFANLDAEHIPELVQRLIDSQ